MKRASAKGARKTLKVSVKPGHLKQLSGQKCARCPEKRDTGNEKGGKMFPVSGKEGHREHWRAVREEERGRERKRGWGEDGERGRRRVMEGVKDGGMEEIVEAMIGGGRGIKKKTT